MSCNNSKHKPSTDTATSGTVSIIADETFKPIIDAEIFAFENIYKYAKLNAVYLPEKEAITSLINDTSRIAILTRKLTPDEMSYFNKIKITIRVTPIALDAIALIINNQNTDSIITKAQINSILKGEITNWKQLGGKDMPLEFIFDNKSSSTLRYLCQNADLKAPTAKNLFAVDSNPAVIDYVSKNKGAIGVIGVNWISDGDDAASLGFLNKIKVMAVAEDAKSEYFKPYQAYIATKKYPLRREVMVVSREARVGLGTGFASFLASDRGQRVIMKSGLLPVNIPVRIIEFPENKDSDRSTDFAD